MELFLGLDLSTQSLKGTIMDIKENIVCERIVQFDRDMPHYGTQNGSIAGSDGEITCPVALWTESVDLLISRFESAGVNFGEVVAVSGAAQVSIETHPDPLCPRDNYLETSATRKCILDKICPGSPRQLGSFQKTVRTINIQGVFVTKCPYMARFLYYSRVCCPGASRWRATKTI
jgi:hypothetical protein